MAKVGTPTGNGHSSYVGGPDTVVLGGDRGGGRRSLDELEGVLRGRLSRVCHGGDGGSSCRGGGERRKEQLLIDSRGQAVSRRPDVRAWATFTATFQAAAPSWPRQLSLCRPHVRSHVAIFCTLRHCLHSRCAPCPMPIDPRKLKNDAAGCFSMFIYCACQAPLNRRTTTPTRSL